MNIDKNNFYYLIQSILTSMLPIIGLPIYLNYISISEYGVYGLCLASSSFFSSIAGFGFQLSFERNFFEKSSKVYHSKLIWTCLSFVILNSILIGFLIFIFKDYLSLLLTKTTDNQFLFFYSYCGLCLISIKMYFLIFFKNKMLAKQFVSFSIGDSVLTLIISLILIIGFDLNILGLIFGQIFSTGFVILIILIYLKIPYGFSYELLEKNFKLSFPLTPRIFIGVLNNQFDKIIIGIIGSTYIVGIYSLGQKIAYVLFNLLNAQSNSFIPLIYKKMFENSKKDNGLISKIVNPYFYFSAFFSVIIILFSKELINLFFNFEFEKSALVVIIITPLYLTFFFGKIPQLLFKKKTGIISAISFFNIIIYIILGYVLTTAYSFIGASFSLLISGLFSTIITFYFSQKYYHILWNYNYIFQIYLMIFSSCLLSYLFLSNDFTIIKALIFKGLFVVIVLYYGFKRDFISINRIIKFLKNLKNV
jgi:O-antigen/teichoic acid export membrane protein